MRSFVFALGSNFEFCTALGKSLSVVPPSIQLKNPIHEGELLVWEIC